MKSVFRAYLALLTLALCATLSRAELAENADHERLSTLRQRQQFAEAEEYCRAELNKSGVAEPRRTDLVIELAQTLGEHALASLPAARGSLWKQADAVVNDFYKSEPNNPRALLVRMQGALNSLAQGELARQDLEIAPAADKPLDESRAAIRAAAKQLKQLDADVAAELVRRHRTKSSALGELSVGELTALLANVRLQLARAFRNQGLCYAADSADRINALTQALETLRPLALARDDDSWAWPARLEEATNLRLLGESAGERKLDAILQGKAPPMIKGRAQAERIRWRLAKSDIDEALAEARGDAGAPESAELAYARLETYLAAWRRASAEKNTSAASQWEQKGIDQVRQIEQNYGAYWMRRAESLLTATIAVSPTTGSVESLARAGASLFRDGKISEALDAYDRATEKAIAAEQPERAFELGLTAATIAHDRGRHREALDRYRKLALWGVRNPRAGEAHLLAIYHAAQLAREANAAPAALDHYAELLAEHSKHWPTGPTANQTLFWTGRLREERRAWPEAIKAYRAIARDAMQSTEAVEGLARCYEAWLAATRAARKPDTELATSAAKVFEGIILGPGAKLPDHWDASARVAALAAARIWMSQPQGHQRAQQILSAALDTATDAPDAWKNTARTLLVTCHAARGETKEATTIIEQMSAAAPAELLALVESLAHASSGLTPAIGRQLGELELQAIDLLDSKRDQLDASAARRLVRLRAQALADAGRRADALKAFESLAKQFPNEGQVQESLASLLLAGTTAEDWHAADLKWREVIDKSRPGTPRWFRANYSVAKAQFLLGDKPLARGTIRLVQATHPEFGSPELKQQFLKLLAECDADAAKVGK